MYIIPGGDGGLSGSTIALIVVVVLFVIGIVVYCIVKKMYSSQNIPVKCPDDQEKPQATCLGYVPISQLGPNYEYNPQDTKSLENETSIKRTPTPIPKMYQKSVNR